MLNTVQEIEDNNRPQRNDFIFGIILEKLTILSFN